MIDTVDLTSYYPGYDDYCESKEYEEVEEDIDAIIDEKRLEEMENENGKEKDSNDSTNITSGICS